MAEFVSFTQVKEQVSMQQVLEHYGLLEGLRVQKGGEELVGICPFHEEKTGSFHVSLAKNKNGAFQCFGCKRKGNILDFVVYIEGLQANEVRKAALMVAEWFQISPETATRARFGSLDTCEFRLRTRLERAYPSAPSGNASRHTRWPTGSSTSWAACTPQ